MSVPVATRRSAAPLSRWVVPGLLLWAVGLGIGWFATARGAAADGELALDQALGAHRSLLGTAIGRFFDLATGPQVAPVLLLVVAGLLWWRRRHETALLLLGLTGVGWVSVALAKMLIARPRPPHDLVHAMSLETSPDSFPSGHVAFAAALLATVVLIAHRRGHPVGRLLLVGVPVVLLDAWARLYWGVHYLADVVAAPLLACGTVLLLAPLATAVVPRAVGLTPSWLGGPRRS
ncbi:phosphatase PAP2 family protein [Arsenicicoccus sp. oral taxon 190]|uniref:phosphatase PAP2 family protein n=1 Tax=Arsenicicoccus sp. oral taxon 190 TaxID=1658671 RepID=UPI00067C506E|nr:phosphatase PAP2 family protein [Arsenicicoccus sp. oral taxon 190]